MITSSTMPVLMFALIEFQFGSEKIKFFLPIQVQYIQVVNTGTKTNQIEITQTILRRNGSNL